MAVGRTPDERFVGEINSLKEQIAALQARPLQIPYVDTDPSTDYKGNIWMFQDGRVRIRLADGTIKELATVASTGATSGTAKPAIAAQPITRVLDVAATWSQAYRQAGPFTGSNPSTNLYYGYVGDSFNGRQSSLVGFDYTTIASLLSGSTVTKVELYLQPLHTWSDSGGTVYFGIHNNSTKPSNYSSAVVVKNYVSSDKVHKGTYIYHQISTEFGARFRDGTAKGVILQAPNNSNTFYGFMSPTVRLRITYVR